MLVTKLQRDDTTEPIWDCVGHHQSDFRPHFDGNLHNFFTAIYPSDSHADTEAKFKDVAYQIADWILNNRTSFSNGDRFQIIVGWPLDVRSTGRQCVKTGGTFEDVQKLVDDRSSISIRDGWHTNVEFNQNAG